MNTQTNKPASQPFKKVYWHFSWFYHMAYHESKVKNQALFDINHNLPSNSLIRILQKYPV